MIGITCIGLVVHAVNHNLYTSLACPSCPNSCYIMQRVKMMFMLDVQMTRSILITHIINTHNRIIRTISVPTQVIHHFIMQLLLSDTQININNPDKTSLINNKIYAYSSILLSPIDLLPPIYIFNVRKPRHSFISFGQKF